MFLQRQNPYEVSQRVGIGLEMTEINPAGVNIEITSEDAIVKKTPLDEYNFLIEQYNNDTNRIGDNYLEKVPTYSCFNCSLCGTTFIIFLSIVPGLGIIAFIIGLSTLITLIKAILIVKKNRRKVPNLFKNMIYSKDIRSKNEYFKITTNYQITRLQAVALADQETSVLFGRISADIQQGVPVQVMAYRNEFKLYEQNVLKKSCIRVYGACYLTFCSFCLFIMWTFIIVVISINSSST